MREDARQQIAPLRQEPGHLYPYQAARPHQAVEDEAQRDDHDGGPHYAPTGQEHQGQADARHDGVHYRVVAGAKLKGLEVDDEVGDHRQKCGGEEYIQGVDPPAARFLRRRIEDEGEADGEAEMSVAQNLLRQTPAQRGVKLKDSEEHQDCRNEDAHAPGEDAIARIAFQLGQIDVCGDFIQFFAMGFFTIGVFVIGVFMIVFLMVEKVQRRHPPAKKQGRTPACRNGGRQRKRGSAQNAHLTTCWGSRCPSPCRNGPRRGGCCPECRGRDSPGTCAPPSCSPRGARRGSHRWPP